MTRRTGAFVLATVISVAGLTGCATADSAAESGDLGAGDTDVMLTLDEAKDYTHAVENEIGAFVPADVVTLTEQHQESSVLFDCEVGYVWPGLLRLELAADVDQDAIAAAIAAEWREKPGWDVEETVSESGTPTVSISGEDGSLFSATFREEGREFRVTSFSPCFDLGEKVDPGEIY
jgi:hypothetical protein